MEWVAVVVAAAIAALFAVVLVKVLAVLIVKGVSPETFETDDDNSLFLADCLTFRSSTLECRAVSVILPANAERVFLRMK